MKLLAWLGLFVFMTRIVTAQDKLLASKPIPVVAWAGIPDSETTPEKFSELREMGITINLTSCTDANAMQKVLDIALQTGLNMITSCPELKTNTEAIVRRFMNHPALAGYFLMDEPVLKDFVGLAEWAKKIEAIDNRHFCFVNLIACIHPEKTDALGTPTYDDYVRTFITEVPVKQISFDFYPVLNTGIHEWWYKGLEIVSAESKKSALPFWGFALASSYNNLHPAPTLAALRLQLFTNLAYGAQGLEYWAYRMNSGLRSAPIGMTGQRTPVYDLIKEVNKEVQAYAGVFAGSKVVSVRHTGTIIPRGTMRLDILPPAIKILETDGEGALVSFLENGDNSFAVVINRSLQNNLLLIIQGDESLKKVLRDGSVVKANHYGNRIEIEPGDMVVYMYPTKKTGQQ
jgi:hypothetical protein